MRRGDLEGFAFLRGNGQASSGKLAGSRPAPSPAGVSPFQIAPYQKRVSRNHIKQLLESKNES